jgi:hypothetical protein
MPAAMKLSAPRQAVAYCQHLVIVIPHGDISGSPVSRIAQIWNASNIERISCNFFQLCQTGRNLIPSKVFMDVRQSLRRAVIDRPGKPV